MTDIYYSGKTVVQKFHQKNKNKATEETAQEIKFLLCKHKEDLAMWELSRTTVMSPDTSALEKLENCEN